MVVMWKSNLYSSFIKDSIAKWFFHVLYCDLIFCIFKLFCFNHPTFEWHRMQGVDISPSNYFYRSNKVPMIYKGNHPINAKAMIFSC